MLSIRSYVIVGAGLLAMVSRAYAAAPPDPVNDDIAKLQKEVRELRQLIIDMHAIEQQHYEFLLKLIQGGTLVPPGAGAPPESTPGAGEPTSAQKKASHVIAEPVAPTGSVEGRVTISGGSSRDIYVYVDNVRAPMARGKALTIEQKGKQFSPTAAVVQRGTRVTFPNMDPVFHNVFSPSPGQPFDLGTYRAGDPPRSVVLTNVGVADIYCNIHSKMRSSILVVPNGLFAKAGADGRYRIVNVPVGQRRVVAWAPDAKPALNTVDVTTAGAAADFSLEVEGERAHNNKVGQPYGSYDN